MYFDEDVLKIGTSSLLCLRFLFALLSVYSFLKRTVVTGRRRVTEAEENIKNTQNVKRKNVRKTLQRYLQGVSF
jgi:hypothetical protein